MNCRDFRELIDSYLCDELLIETNHDVLSHLEVCADCRGVIETRRILRSKIKSAVLSSPEFQVREDFCRNLSLLLKNASAVEPRAQKVSWAKRTNWLAFAAGLIFAAGLGFWFLQSQPAQISPPETAGINNEDLQQISLANFAVGDHQNCAVKYNLDENPIDIDLASAQHADLQQGILNPLQNSEQKYEFLESHICRYAGHEFTHIVFRHQGKTVSVILTDLQNYPALKPEQIVKIAAAGYQIARFDVKNKAIFVVSDLPEQENTATARILENPLNRRFILNEQAKINHFSDDYLSFRMD